MYRSGGFLPIIEANLQVLAGMPDVEVLVSDRHGLDDCLERLRNIHGTDPRFQFFTATDGIDWVAHYNWLLAQARGAYFAWMPHDDTFPPGYYSGLVDYLDGNADTLLAFGPIIGIDEQEKELPWAAHLQNPPPWNSPGRWTARNAWRMLRFLPWEPIRGVFRREPIVRAGLNLRSTLDNQSADRGWVFGVGLRGPIRFVAVPPCVKRYYAASTHRATMRRDFWSYSSLYPALARYTIRQSPSIGATVVGLAHVAWRYVVNMIVPRVRIRIAFRGWLRRLRRLLAG
jgi:Glycosyl transferase family 2